MPSEQPLVISVQNLGKRYRLGHAGSHNTLRDHIAVSVQRAFGGFKKNGARKGSRKPEDFWAVRDISFDVHQGEVIGIIGRNGAGKSTLLKILSQITEPTEGEIRVRGRIASLLEVGTGFHPELTGRENIFLNGAVLGMTRREIYAKFDEIVDFSEVEQFLDTPVKRYSSGMYVRLAFAVAAHLEPEILVVDEVLAVGDAQFQKKCLGKMEDVSRQGRTVLFVSHNMSAIEMLCTRALLLEAGHLQLDDAAPAVVKHYLDLSYSLPQGRLAERTDRKGNGVVRAVNFRIFDESGAEQTSVQSGRDYIFEVEYENRGSDRIDNVALSIDFFDERNIRILLFRSSFDAQNVAINPRRGRIRCAVKNLPLANGLYRISLYLSAREDTELLDWIEDAALLTVSGGDFFETGSQGFPPLCKVLVKASWSSI